LVQMTMTFQKKREEEFLDECTEYCQREVLSRLRMGGASGGVNDIAATTESEFLLE
jgi:hypothetical protein